MAINPNPSKANRHTLIMATSGMGKTTLLKNQMMLRKTRVIFWDPNLDHKATIRVKSLQQFYSQLVSQAKSEKGHISIAVSIDRNQPVVFEKFCRVIWEVLDGNRDTVIVIEELANVSMTSHKAGPEFGRMIREGRKFGAVIYATTQRMQEIDKTIFTQVQTKIVGGHDIRDAEFVSRYINIPAQDIYNLKIGEFYTKDLGPTVAKKIKARTKPTAKPTKKPTPRPTANRLEPDIKSALPKMGSNVEKKA